MASHTETQVNETRNWDGSKEIVVETVDYRSSAGQGHDVKGVGVEVIHQLHDDCGIGPGILGAAAAKVADTVQSAKSAISGDPSSTGNK